MYSIYCTSYIIRDDLGTFERMCVCHSYINYVILSSFKVQIASFHPNRACPFSSSLFLFEPHSTNLIIITFLFLLIGKDGGEGREG